MKTSQDIEQFLINPFGMMYSEVTAANLLKVDLYGNIIDPGTTQLGCNQAGYVLHSAIHEGRPEIQCVIHVHTAAGVAVSTMACGLLPISQEALTVRRSPLSRTTRVYTHAHTHTHTQHAHTHTHTHTRTHMHTQWTVAHFTRSTHCT